jgi:hypothetical protein
MWLGPALLTGLDRVRKAGQDLGHRVHFLSTISPTPSYLDC